MQFHLDVETDQHPFHALEMFCEDSNELRVQRSKVMHCAPVLLPSYLAQGREAARGIVALAIKMGGRSRKGGIALCPQLLCTRGDVFHMPLRWDSLHNHLSPLMWASRQLVHKPIH